MSLQNTPASKILLSQHPAPLSCPFLFKDNPGIHPKYCNQLLSWRPFTQHSPSHLVFKLLSWKRPAYCRSAPHHNLPSEKKKPAWPERSKYPSLESHIAHSTSRKYISRMDGSTRRCTRPPFLRPRCSAAVRQRSGMRWWGHECVAFRRSDAKLQTCIYM